MPLFFLIFALASLAAAGVLLLSVAIGAWLLFSGRSRTLGIFLLVVPTLSALSAVAASWGGAFWFNSLSAGARSPGELQRLQVMALWAWPVGFVVGGVAGASVGTAITALVARRPPPDKRRATSPGISNAPPFVVAMKDTLAFSESVTALVTSAPSAVKSDYSTTTRVLLLRPSFTNRHSS